MNINIFWFSIALGILVFIILIVLIGTQGNRKIFKRGTILYVIVSFIVFVALGTTGFLIKTHEISYLPLFYSLQALLLLLGVFHTWIMFSALPWSNRRNFFSEALFTVWVVLLGSLGFIGA